MNYKDFCYKMDYYKYLMKQHEFSHDGNVHKIYDLALDYFDIQINFIRANDWEIIYFNKKKLEAEAR